MAVTPLASEPAQEKRGRDWRWTKSRLRGWPWLIPMGLIAISTIYPIFFTINVALKTKKAFVMGRFLWRQRHPETPWDWEQKNDEHFHAGMKKA